MNKVIFDGRLTRDPEVRYTTSGKAIASLSVAINSGTKDKPEVYFADIVAWEKLAELCQSYIFKGSHVLVEGKLKSEEWQDKQTGQKRSKTTIVAQSVQFLDTRSDNNQNASEPAQRANNAYHGQAVPFTPPAMNNSDNDSPF